MKNSVNISMPSAQNNSLVVGVNSISYTPDPRVETNTFSLTPNGNEGFHATIDSTLPYLYLPTSVCDQFEQRFQLTYDQRTNYYFYNSSSNNYNENRNATLNFKIGANLQDSPYFADIKLPWTAFKMDLSLPDMNTTRPYFPLRRSPDGIYMLGRAFLQEAYLVVDYERNTFTVASATFSDPMPDEKLVPIYTKEYKSDSPTPLPKPSGGGISGGAIAGIVIGVVALIAGAVLVSLWWWRKRNPKPPAYKVAEIDTMVAGNEVKHRRVSELDSQPPGSPKSAIAGYYGTRDRKDVSPFPGISEMYSPPMESSPAELSDGDYFTVGGKLRRRAATRESSTANTPGTSPFLTPMAELPGDDGMQFNNVDVVARSSSFHSRGPSNIDEMISAPSAQPSPAAEENGPVAEAAGNENEEDKGKGKAETEGGEQGRRPSQHTRGLSNETAVSNPTSEELAQWKSNPHHPERPVSQTE